MLKSRLIDELRKRPDELFALCSRLVQIPSENPPGDTSKLASFIRDHLAAQSIAVDWHEPMAGRPNLVATMGAGSGPNVVLSGHLDEFPAGQGWTRPPFSGAIEAGRIWGRGAGDMKAGLAVALTIVSLVRELEIPLAGRLTLAFASDEETGGAWGTQWLLANVPAVRGDACLIGESSGTWSAGIGEKGVLWLRLRSRGVSGHAAYQQGTSAVAAVRGALAAIEPMHGRRARAGKAVAGVILGQRGAAERRWGRGTGRLADTVALSVGTLEGGGQVNLIPASAMAEVDFRVPPGLTTAAIEREARRRIKQVSRGTVEVEVFNQCDPYVTPPEATLVKHVLANARQLNRRKVLPVVRLGYTDGRFFRRAGIPTVVYGPAVHNMGGPDEYIETADLLEVAAVHAGAVLDLLAPGSRVMAGEWRIAGIDVLPGTRARSIIELTELPDGSRVKLPVALVHGSRPGPTLYLGAAIHGDEANGVAIATRVLAAVNATALSGRLVCVPVQNPLAFQVDHRVPVGLYLKTPLDQSPMDPWTTFPGDAAGTITERLSHTLFSLIRGCDAAIDVHTPTRGGRYVPITILPHPSLPAYDKADALGRAFGSGWIMATDQGMYVRDGILCVEATRAGVPCFTFEIGEGGRVEEAATETGTRCVLNAMRHLGMLPAVTESRIPSVRMSAFLGLRASRGGLLTTDVELGVRVAKGITLARIHDVYGDLVETINAPCEGYFVRSTTFAAVASGERVATLGVD